MGDGSKYRHCEEERRSNLLHFSRTDYTQRDCFVLWAQLASLFILKEIASFLAMTGSFRNEGDCFVPRNDEPGTDSKSE